MFFPSANAVQLHRVKPASLNQSYTPTRVDGLAGASPRFYRLCVAGLWVGVATYIALFCVLVLDRHDRLTTTIFDLGIYDQATWLISRGQPAFLTTRGLYPLQDHFAPILYLLAPLYWIHDSPKTLLIFQVIVLALGAVPLFYLALRRLGNAETALILTVAYLFYPAMQWMNLFDFHPECLAPPLMLLAFWFLEKRSWKPFFLTLLLLMACKETMGLTIIMLGAYVGVTANRRAGIATALFGIAGLVVAMTTLRILNHGQPSQYFSFYAAYGTDISTIAAFLCTHPLKVLAAVLSEDNSGYLIALLSPLAFLALAAPEVSVLALPALLSNMLSSRAAMHSITYQYNSIVIPILFVATVEGIRTGMTLLPPNASESRGHIRIAIPLLLLAGGTIFGFTSGPFCRHIGSATEPAVSLDHAATACRALSLIPGNASVSAQAAIGAHLAHRKRLYLFPNPFQAVTWGNEPKALEQQYGRAIPILPADLLHRRLYEARIDYIVLGPAGSSHFPLRDDAYAHLVGVVLDDANYGAIWTQAGMVILKRGSDHAGGQQMLRRAMLAGDAPLVRTDKTRN